MTEPGVCANESCGRPDENGDWQRTAATRTFCDRCEHRIADVLRDLPGWYVNLHVHLGDASVGGEKVSGSRSAPVPLNLEVEALIADLEGTLVSWENALRAAWGWPAKMDPAGPPGVRFQATCRWLGAALTPLLAFPGGDAAGQELLDLGARCRRMLGETRLVHRLPAPCPSCDFVTLQREDGDDEVRCTTCRRTWTAGEYERLVLILASEQRATMPGKKEAS